MHYNYFVFHFLRSLHFPLRSLPGECLQVLLINLLQFVALQIALCQYSQLFPKRIFSQPEQEWLWHSVSACLCENLAYYNLCGSWSSWKQCMPSSTMSACLKDCHRIKFWAYSTTFLFSGEITVLKMSIALRTHSFKCRGLRLNNVFEGFQRCFSPKPH